MNRLRLARAIGSPWHGRALDDVFSLGPQPPRQVATRPQYATWGPAVPIVHPAAPGAGELAGGNDLAWGQYIGHTRSINGADGGVGIGWNRWLYCDPVTDATWLMRLEHIDGNTDVELQVWCDGVFGRLGRQYAHAPRLLQSFTWAPDLPSWKVGSDTPSNAVSQLQWGSHEQLAISRDGSRVYLHLFTSPGGVSDSMYCPTNQTGHYWGLDSGNAVCSIVQIDIAGSNAAGEDGAALTATIAKAMPYENTGGGGQVSGYSKGAAGYAHNSIIYKTEDGEVKRNYSFTNAGRLFSVSFDIWGQVWSNNGAAVSIYGSGQEIKVYAQNAVYLATYRDPGGPPYIFDQRWVCLDWLGQASTPYTLQANSSHIAQNSGEHEMPYTRKWVGTMSPADPVGTFEIYDAVYLVPYVGTTYQRL